MSDVPVWVQLGVTITKASKLAVAGRDVGPVLGDTFEAEPRDKEAGSTESVMSMLEIRPNKACLVYPCIHFDKSSVYGWSIVGRDK